MTKPQFLRFLEPAEESALLAAAPPKAYAPGEVVVEIGVPLRGLYVIDEGSVRIERPDGDRFASLGVLGPGQLFGEMSFVDGAVTSARVIAHAPTRLRMIDMAVVDNLSEVDPTFGARLFRSLAAMLAERLRLTSMDVLLRKPWV
jgi:extracellular factor (EF) 3-hydroxypalmitic acid methyl ester biosynthesis protein